MYSVVLNKNTKNNCTIKFTFKFKVHVKYVVMKNRLSSVAHWMFYKLKLLLRHWM